MIPESVQRLVESGPIAYLTTLNTDGSPQVTMVWVGTENGEFVMGHMGDWKKLQNVRQDPRVALSILGTEKNAMGLLEYCIVYGSARVTEGGAAALLQRLAHIYMGPQAEFPPEPFRAKPGYITRLQPERFAGIGPWAPGQR